MKTGQSGASHTPPHKSTTHEELFFHLIPAKDPALLNVTPVTFFWRKDDKYWRLSWAICAPGDVFSRKTGRTVARRRYFTKGAVAGSFDKPTYAKCAKMVNQLKLATEDYWSKR